MEPHGTTSGTPVDAVSRLGLVLALMLAVMLNAHNWKASIWIGAVCIRTLSPSSPDLRRVHQ